MPSPPSPPRPRDPRTAPSTLKLLLAFAGFAVLALAAGCGSAGGRAPAAAPVDVQRLPNLAPAEAPYLVSPLAGYLLRVPLETEERLEGAHREMLERGTLSAVEAARETALELLSADPRLDPAAVLLAQTDFAGGLYGEAVERVGTITEELPGYLAAQLVLGRAADRLGDLTTAYAAYREAGEGSAAARERAEEILPRALEIVSHRVEDAIRRDRLDDADEDLARLELWAPGGETTLEAAAGLAHARGDTAAELAAVRQLAQLRPEDLQLTERWADLELLSGNPAAGLDLFEQLAAAHPGDSELEEKVGYAKFRWRLSLLPQRVQEVSSRAELERGDWAVLLYWLLPSVRYGETSRPRIAADILDDPRREEIARVINLGLMDVNESLHRFSPEEPVSRLRVLNSLLQVLATAQQPVACVQGLPAAPSAELACQTAARCALLRRAEECLPWGPISGREALSLLRRTLELTGAR